MTRRDLARDADGNLLIDVRGPRFSAVITATVLTTALLLRGSVGTALVVWQWAVFATGALAGLAWSPYGNLFRFLKRRIDLGPPPAVEGEAGPRFAQFCGLAVTSIALGALALGAPVLAWSAVGVVLALSLLLATTGLCVGCELYVIGQRLGARTGAGTDHRGDPRRDAPADDAAPVRVAPALTAADLVAVGLGARNPDGALSPDGARNPDGPRSPEVAGDADGTPAMAVLLGSPTCARCPQVETVLAATAERVPGFRWVRVDAGDHLDLTRRLKVLRVPTVLVVDAGGNLLARTTSVPTVDRLVAAIDDAAAATDHLADLTS